MADRSDSPIPLAKMLWPLCVKSWLETRSRFLLGLVTVAALCMAIVLWQGPLRARLSGIGPIVAADPALATLSYPEYIHRLVYAGPVQRLGQLLALILAMGGLQKERETGTTALTLALPVRRRHLMGVRAAVGILQVSVLALIPALLIPASSPFIGESYPVSQALGFSVLSVSAHATIFSAALVVSTIVPGQLTALLVAGLLQSAHAAAALLPVLQPLRISLNSFATGVGMPYFDPATSLLISLPWIRLAVMGLLSFGFLTAGSRMTERQDY